VATRLRNAVAELGQLQGGYSQQTFDLASQTLRENRVAIFIVAYNAERHIESVLARIPDWVARSLVEVFVIDDSSKDATIDRAVSVEWAAHYAPLRVFRTPYNQGYGGNQRLGYLYAIDRGFDIVVLLHGDGQYAPELLPEILAEYSRPGGADAVYGSRFLTRSGALRGGMPLYKYVGNRILTSLQNRIAGGGLSEWHSGYRSYRTAALKKVPFHANNLGFAFDSDIIIQFLTSGLSIREVPIPTYYGEEICRVNGLKYAWACVKAALQYRLMQCELFYDPKFDVGHSARKYSIKRAPTSLHYYIRNLPAAQGSELLDLGGGDGAAVSLAHAERGVSVTVLDQCHTVTDELGKTASANPNLRRIQGDLDGDWPSYVSDRRFSVVFALDVLEHLKSPELAAQQIFSAMAPDGKLYASTGNVGFWAIRLILLLGHFNYGRRGILDLTHSRLFTLSSFRRLLRNAGFRIDSVQCFGPPVADLIPGNPTLLRWIDSLSARLARRWKKLFAYQILVEATRPQSVETLMERTFADHRLAPAEDSDTVPSALASRVRTI
jgi:glycosyltransferase involved in cell wall biosynthesis